MTMTTPNTHPTPISATRLAELRAKVQTVLTRTKASSSARAAFHSKVVALQAKVAAMKAAKSATAPTSPASK